MAPLLLPQNTAFPANSLQRYALRESLKGKTLCDTMSL